MKRNVSRGRTKFTIGLNGYYMMMMMMMMMINKVLLRLCTESWKRIA